jgi:hypothetical protein
MRTEYHHGTVSPNALGWTNIRNLGSAVTRKTARREARGIKHDENSRSRTRREPLLFTVLSNFFMLDDAQEALLIDLVEADRCVPQEQA